MVIAFYLGVINAWLNLVKASIKTSMFSLLSFKGSTKISQLVEQWTVMQQVPGSIPAPISTWQGLTQPSIPLWVGKMSTSIDGEWRNNVHSK